MERGTEKKKQDAGCGMQDEKKTERVKWGRYSHEDTKRRRMFNAQWNENTERFSRKGAKNARVAPVESVKV
ncbi:MAG: hypothetical protein P9M00_11310 [Candidatus Tritonobacter lacicola]|nr:hypothetical protein [Candidatus Tritonobacter lacicola]